MMRLLQANVEVPFERQADFKQLMQNMGRSVAELNDKVYMIWVILPTMTQRAINLVNPSQFSRESTRLTIRIGPDLSVAKAYDDDWSTTIYHAF